MGFHIDLSFSWYVVVIVMPIVLRLDRVMADRKISLNELAEQVGITNVNLSRMKTGKVRAVRFSTLTMLCNVLECQPGDILEYGPESECAGAGRARSDCASGDIFESESCDFSPESAH